MLNPETLIPFCTTERQKEIMSAIATNKTVTEACKNVNCDRRYAYRLMKKLEERAASQGVAPHRDLTHQTAEGFNAKRISTAYKEDGSIALQWVIQEPEKRDLRQKIDAMVDGLRDDLIGYKKPVKPPKIVDNDYCAQYLVGDHHFGMLASAETKMPGDDANWDIKIATQVLIDSVDRLSTRVGNAHTGVLVNVGDFFHEDGKQMTTAGTPVDVDTRINRTFRLAGRLFQTLIDKMLEVHQEVVVINVRGNHDSDIACHLSSCLDLLYDKEPRVKVLKNYSKFIHWEWENNLFIYHHGDRVKHEQILQAVVTNLDEEWSRCKNRYCHMGHIHHQMSKEIGSLIFEHFSSLTSTDQWHSDSGYGANRSMTAIVYHKKNGEDSRVKITIDALNNER